jgi:S-disulfanyl-L-cysteine oxidoreductase SoxD
MAGVHQHEGSPTAGRGGWRRWLSQVGRALASVALFAAIAGCANPGGHGTSISRPAAPIPPASSPEAVATGANLAQQHCVRCPMEGGPGAAAAAQDQAGQAWTGHAWHHPDSLLVQMIADGVSRPTGVMPPFGSVLRPEEIHTLIAFIKTLWTPEQQQFQRERTQRADVGALAY